MNTQSSTSSPTSFPVSPLVGDFNVRYFLEVLFRRKDYILVPLILTPVLCLGLTFLMKPSYLSTTTILLGKQDILNPLLRRETAVTMEDLNRLSSFQKIILSRPLIEEAMDTVGMSKTISTPYEREKMVKRVRQNIEIMGLQTDSFQIGYTAPTPKFAKDMAEAISRLFIEKSLTGSRREAEAAVTFIKKAVDHYRKELNRTERELQQFQHDNAETLQQNKFLGRELQSYETRLLDAGLQLQAEQLREQLLARQLKGESKMVIQKAVYLSNTRYQAKYQELRLKKAQLLATRTEEHPEVQTILREMDNIKSMVDEESKMNPAAETEKVRSPTYHAIASDLEQTRVMISVLKQKVKDFTRFREVAREKVKQIPELERIQTRMASEVTLTRDIYDNLRMKLEQAQVSRDIEIEQQASRYTIIDPPLIPLRRHKPIRSLYAAVGLIGGLFIGLIFAFIVELTAPQLNQATELTALGVPVIGGFPSLCPYEGGLFHWLFGSSSPPPGERSSPVLPNLILDAEAMKLTGAAQDAPPEGLEPFIEHMRFIGFAINASGQVPEGGICMVTSAMCQDGKSLLAANLAVVQAHDRGKPVLLIDLNPKHPTNSSIFGCAGDSGLGDVMEGHEWLKDVLRPTEIPNLTVLATGDIPGHPTALLNRDFFSDLLDHLRANFSLIIIDAPNVMDNSEGYLLASHADGVVVVCRLFHTRKHAVAEALHRLPRDKFLGLVVNGNRQWLPNWLDRRV